MKRARTLLAIVAVLGTFAAQAQGGVRFILLHTEPIYPKPDYDVLSYPLDSRESGHVGFGYDHDLEDRLSMSVEMMFSYSKLGGEFGAITFQHRADYHFASTSGPSAYFGTVAGFRKVDMPVYKAEKWSEGSRVVFPLGLRFGVRGGLEGFYADAYVGMNYQVGGKAPAKITTEVPPVGLTFVFGVNIGVGWDKRSTR